MALSPTTALELIEPLATALSQAYQVARVRMASSGSPVLRMMVQRDEVVTEVELLRREIAILRGQREEAPPHRRAEYTPEQRLAIVQLQRLRRWTLAETAQHFVIHENTLRHWVQAAEGQGNAKLLEEAVVWNQIDDVVRHAVQELRWLCPEPEFGTRAMARELVKAAIQISRSSVQRILREPPPEQPKVPNVKKPELRKPVGVVPDRLLVPTKINEVWHMDFVRIQVLWMTFYVAAILDSFSRKLLAFKVYRHTPRTRNALALVRQTVQEHGKPSHLITDHGCQFRQRFKDGLQNKLGIKLFQGPVRSPHWNGKVERIFRTFRLWWCLVLTGWTLGSVQRRLDDWRYWYNEIRIHSALGVRTPQEAWAGQNPPTASGVSCPRKAQHCHRHHADEVPGGSAPTRDRNHAPPSGLTATHFRRVSLFKEQGTPGARRFGKMAQNFLLSSQRHSSAADSHRQFWFGASLRYQKTRTYKRLGHYTCDNLLTRLCTCGAVQVVPGPQGKRLRVANAEAFARVVHSSCPQGLDAIESVLTSRADAVEQYGDAKAIGAGSVQGVFVRTTKPGIALRRMGTAEIVDVTTLTRLAGGAAIMLANGVDWGFTGTIATIENEEAFWRHELVLPEVDLGIYVRGKMSIRLLRWLASVPMADCQITHWGDYDPIGVLEYLRLRRACPGRVRLHVPPDLERLLVRYGKRRLIQAGRQTMALCALRRQVDDETVQQLVRIFDQHRKGLEQEILLSQPAVCG